VTSDPGATAIRIGDRLVGDGQPVFVIAEIGVNHNGDMALARELVDAAASCGADVAKFQTFTAERLVTPSAAKAAYQLETTDPGESQFAMLKKLELTVESHEMLQRYAASRGVLFLSSAFDAVSADMLETVGVPAFKLGSGELSDLPFLAHVARKRRPMILSTGMAWLAEVERAVECVRAAGATEVALLHCVSQYPAPIDASNLRAMDTLRAAFRVPVGYSDHTEGLAACIGAVARGAAIVEKHLTLDRGMEGPDHKASADPAAFEALVRAIRDVERALGDGVKRPLPAEENTRTIARKSLVLLQAVPKGIPLTAAMLGSRRPGTGIPPSELDQVIGRTLRADTDAQAVLTWEMFA